MKIMKNTLFWYIVLKTLFSMELWQTIFFKYFYVCYKNSLPQHYIWFHKYFRIFTVEIIFRILLSVSSLQHGSWYYCYIPPLFAQNTLFDFSIMQNRQSSLGRWVSTELNYINIVTQQFFISKVSQLVKHVAHVCKHLQHIRIYIIYSLLYILHVSVCYTFRDHGTVTFPIR